MSSAPIPFKRGHTFPPSTTDEIRQDRKRHVQLVHCGGCQKSGGVSEMKKCAQCKRVVYCSKECQKKDWKSHKAMCAPLPQESDLRKFCTGIMGNQDLRFWLGVAFAHEFDLYNDPSPNKRYFAQLQVVIEPSNIQDFVKLAQSTRPIDKSRIEGMFQIGRIVSKDRGTLQIEATNLGSLPPGAWESTRQEVDAEGHPTWPIVFLEFYYRAGTDDQDFRSCITTSSLNPVMGCSLKVDIPSWDGLLIRKDMTVDTIVERINALIRRDKGNQWLLRMPMRECDKKIVKEAVNQAPARNLAVAALQYKMRRETVYRDQAPDAIQHLQAL